MNVPVLRARTSPLALLISAMLMCRRPSTLCSALVTSKRLAQRHRLEIPDFHGSRKRQHVAELVYLAHGFIQDGGNNAAMCVARRARCIFATA